MHGGLTLARLRAAVAQGARYQHHYLALGRPSFPEQRPIVLLHGFMGDMFAWQYCMVPFTRQGRVIALDLPGHGLAHAQRIGDLDELTTWLEDALDALDIGQCHLVAHSFGGWIALQSAMRHPRRVRSLSLIACAGLERSFDFTMLKAALEVTEFDDAVRYARGLSGQADVCPQAEEDASIALFAQHHLALISDRVRRQSLLEVLELMMDAVARGTVHRVDWSALRPPVQFLWAANDGVVPMPQLAAFPVQANISLRQDGGHVPHILAPGWVNDEVGRFLSTHSLRPS